MGSILASQSPPKSRDGTEGFFVKKSFGFDMMLCIASRGSKSRPRCPKTPPRVPQDAPRGRQECSRRLQEGLKRPQEPVKRTNSSLKSLFVWHVTIVNALTPYCMSEKQANSKNAQLRCRATEWQTGMPKHGGRAAVSPQRGRQSAATRRVGACLNSFRNLF